MSYIAMDIIWEHGDIYLYTIMFILLCIFVMAYVICRAMVRGTSISGAPQPCPCTGCRNRVYRSGRCIKDHLARDEANAAVTQAPPSPPPQHPPPWPPPPDGQDARREPRRLGETHANAHLEGVPQIPPWLDRPVSSFSSIKKCDFAIRLQRLSVCPMRSHT